MAYTAVLGLGEILYQLVGPMLIAVGLVLLVGIPFRVLSAFKRGMYD